MGAGGSTMAGKKKHTRLQDKVEELEKANNDMSNLLNCTDVATVFLDTQLRIKWFTPNTTRMFNLIATDLGRPLRDITLRFTDPQLQREAEEVLRERVPREKEVRVEDGTWYLRRILPYRTRENRSDGVVITFVDITERKKTSDAVVRHLAQGRAAGGGGRHGLSGPRQQRQGGQRFGDRARHR
jgi:two-component system CheB/CheR fusion protein